MYVQNFLMSVNSLLDVTCSAVPSPDPLKYEFTVYSHLYFAI